MTDPGRLREFSFFNLVGNAIKFTEIGSVRLILRSASTSNGEHELRFDVIDTGIGMTEEQMDPVVPSDFASRLIPTTRRFGWQWAGLGDK